MTLETTRIDLLDNLSKSISLYDAEKDSLYKVIDTCCIDIRRVIDGKYESSRAIGKNHLKLCMGTTNKIVRMYYNEDTTELDKEVFKNYSLLLYNWCNALLDVYPSNSKYRHSLLKLKEACNLISNIINDSCDCMTLCSLIDNFLTSIKKDSKEIRYFSFVKEYLEEYKNE